MLDIKKTESMNTVNIVGVLKELYIEEKVTSDKRGYVQGKAIIAVDQEIDGAMVENEIPVRMFSMKKKKDGTDNAVYAAIVRMKENFTSLAAAETPSQASRVAITSGQLQENCWYDKTKGTVRTGFQISSNFMNKAKDEQNNCATFELTGVIGQISEETDRNGDETGNVLVKLIVVGYPRNNNGYVEVINLVAKSPLAVEHIRNNWNQGDTVRVAGIVNISYHVTTWKEEQGFGDAIERTKTETKKELIITSGSATGFDEENSYDSDSIKIALNERSARLEELKTKGSAPQVKKATSNSNGFGF